MTSKSSSELRNYPTASSTDILSDAFSSVYSSRKKLMRSDSEKKKKQVVKKKIELKEKFESIANLSPSSKDNPNNPNNNNNDNGNSKDDDVIVDNKIKESYEIEESKTRNLRGSGTVVVGLCGPPGIGKTTLSKELKRKLLSFYSPRVINVDIYEENQYKISPNGDDTGGGVLNRTLGTSFKAKTLAIDIEKSINTGKELLKTSRVSEALNVIIVEGISLYSHRVVGDKLSHKFLIEASKSICRKRYINKQEVTLLGDDYFASTGAIYDPFTNNWNNYQDNALSGLGNDDVIIPIEGNNSLEKIVNQICSYIID